MTIQDLINSGWQVTGTFTAQGYLTTILANRSGSMTAMVTGDDVQFFPTGV